MNYSKIWRKNIFILISILMLNKKGNEPIPKPVQKEEQNQEQNNIKIAAKNVAGKNKEQKKKKGPCSSFIYKS